MGMEGKDPAAQPVAGHRRSCCDHPADRAIAVGQGIGKGAVQGLKGGIDRDPLRPLPPVHQHLGSRTDRREPGLHQDLIRSRLAAPVPRAPRPGRGR
jgi:hypothetical protein